MRNKLYSFFLLFIATAFQFPLHSQQLKIGLFNDSAIQTYIFSSETGNYKLQYDSTHSINVERGSLLYIALLDSQLSIRDARSGSILISSALLTSPDSDATFSLRPAYPAMNARKYKGNCSFTIGFRRIQAVNEIRLNDYLTAVVAAEGGISATLEFYKAQAILCRTFLLAHSTKHETDGFNVCDGTHCQAYHGMDNRNPDILKAIIATENDVAVYADTILITAAYHSNCGGETQNSENEWLQILPYLRSVKDSFCMNTRNRNWDLKIPRKKWLDYMAKNGIKYNETDSLNSIDCLQLSRKGYYVVHDDSVAFRKIRADWGLKSSFFSVKSDSTGTVLLIGKGYGHGIGMCQFGAMNMAMRGYNYKDILNYYFTNISVKKACELRIAAFN